MRTLVESIQLPTGSNIARTDVDGVVNELRELYHYKGFELADAIGRLILERIYGGNTDAWHARGRKDTSFKKLEKHPDLPMRASTLWKSVALHLVTRRRPDLLEMKNLGPSHVHELIGF